MVLEGCYQALNKGEFVLDGISCISCILFDLSITKVEPYLTGMLIRIIMFATENEEVRWPQEHPFRR